MKKSHIDHILNQAVNFSESSGAWKISLPIILVTRFLLDETEKRMFEQYGLIHSETDVLATLYFNEKLLSPTALYEAMLFSSGGMTKVLKRLEEKGLISRVPCTADKRSLLVQLEPKGEAVIEEVLHMVSQYQADFFAVLDEEEKRIVEKAFRKLAYASLGKGE